MQNSYTNIVLLCFFFATHTEWKDLSASNLNAIAYHVEFVYVLIFLCNDFKCFPTILAVGAARKIMH